jgi:hypothetical protein
MVCLHQGLPKPHEEDRFSPISDLVENWLDGGAADRYDVILFFSGNFRPTIEDGLNSPLCRYAAFEPITAAPPVI